MHSRCLSGLEHAHNAFSCFTECKQNFVYLQENSLGYLRAEAVTMLLKDSRSSTFLLVKEAQEKTKLVL